MSRCLAKASGGPQETRSGVGLGMGSHLVLERLVAPMFKPKRTYGFCTPGRGGYRRVPREPRPDHMRQRVRVRYRVRRRAREKAPFAPSPYRSAGGGFPEIFLPFFVTMLFKENVNGY